MMKGHFRVLNEFKFSHVKLTNWSFKVNWSGSILAQDSCLYYKIEILNVLCRWVRHSPHCLLGRSPSRGLANHAAKYQCKIPLTQWCLTLPWLISRVPLQWGPDNWDGIFKEFLWKSGDLDGSEIHARVQISSYSWKLHVDWTLESAKMKSHSSNPYCTELNYACCILHISSLQTSLRPFFCVTHYPHLPPWVPLHVSNLHTCK